MRFLNEQRKVGEIFLELAQHKWELKLNKWKLTGNALFFLLSLSLSLTNLEIKIFRADCMDKGSEWEIVRKRDWAGKRMFMWDGCHLCLCVCVWRQCNHFQSPLTYSAWERAHTIRRKSFRKFTKQQHAFYSMLSFWSNRESWYSQS